jgi:DNA-binding CsgD family transcriptional regulator
VPAYGVSETYIGRGIVGGSVINFKDQGRLAAELALRVLDGEDPDSITPLGSNSTHMFDWRQLRRWGLNQADLLAGSVVNFRERSLWEAYRSRVIGIISICILQAILITALLIERRMRRRTESHLRESEQRMSLAAHATGLGMWLSDIARDEIWSNPQGRVLLGDELLSAIGAAIEKNLREQRERAQVQSIEQRLGTLIRRAREVMTLVVTGMLSKQVADVLRTTEKTIKVPRARMMEKMQAHSLAELVHLAQVGIGWPGMTVR